MTDGTIWTLDDDEPRERKVENKTDPRLTGEVAERKAPPPSEPRKDENGRFVPEVGMGCTLFVGSDRYPYTIVSVHKNGRQFEMVEDRAVRRDCNGLSEDQTYDYSPNPVGVPRIVKKHADGHWSNGGTSVGVGFRRKYIDPSF